MSEQLKIESPVIVIYENPDTTLTIRIWPKPGFTHGHYGLIVCDLVRNVAAAYGVDADDVWEFVDRERDAPTTDLKRVQ